MKYFCTIFLFLSVLNIAAQKVVASLPELNVIYLELDNEIEISAEGYKESDLVKKTINATLIKKDGKQFIKPLKRGEALLIVGTLKNKDTLWLDTTEFRARILPKPHPQMGTIQDGEIQSIGVIRANANRLFLSYGEGFMVKGFRGNILGFTCTIIDSLGIDSWDVEGSRTTKEIKNRLMRISDYGKIIFSDFEYFVTRDGDTIITPGKLKNEKVVITVRAHNSKPLFPLIKDKRKEKIFYHLRPLYSIKGQFKTVTNPFYYNSLFSGDDYLNLHISKAKIGKWQFFSGIGKEQYLYMEEDYDTLGNLTSYKKYDKSGFNTLNISLSSKVDSVYYIEKHPNGKVKLEGWVTNSFDNYYFKGEKVGGCSFPSSSIYSISIWSYFKGFKFIPLGNWTEYYEDGNIKTEISFINEIENGKNIIIVNGPLIEYDKEGNILQQYFYKNGYFIREVK